MINKENRIKVKKEAVIGHCLQLVRIENLAKAEFLSLSKCSPMIPIKEGKYYSTIKRFYQREMQ
jgi:hypothetical protein